MRTHQVRASAGKSVVAPADGWRLYYCRVCGHIEWLAPGETLPKDFRCPLCEAPRAAFVTMDDPKYAACSLAIAEAGPGLFQVDRVPGFPADWQHYSYLLAHPAGTILYDAPP
jgi:hypothetical protein